MSSSRSYRRDDRADSDSHRDRDRDRERDRLSSSSSHRRERRRAESPSAADDKRRRSRSPDRDHHRHHHASSSSRRSRRDEEGDAERDHRDSKRARDYDRDRDRDRDCDRSRDRDRDERRSRDKDRDSVEKSSSKKIPLRHKHRETSEERRARKAARKAEKLADAALLLPEEARQAAAEVAFYSAQDNPFHDANLGDKFVWGKKREKERKMGLTPDEAAKRDRERAWESQQEIERLNQRRAEREKEAILREQEQMQQMRFAESAQMAAWIDKEDDFHLEQAKKRAEIRVRERRAKPIDYLALNLKWSQPPLEPGDEGYEEQEEEEDDGAGLEVDLEEPYAIFDHLALEDAEELHDDIKMYLSLEKVESHQEFWRALLIVSSATLEALREERSIGTSAYQAQTRANAAVKAEITRLLSGKSHDQLVQLQQQVQAKLASGEVIDVDYWEGLLKELVVQKAKAKLRDMHEVVLNNRLEQLRKKQRDEALRYAQEVKNAIFVPPPAEALERLDEEEEDMQIEEEEEEEGAATVAEKWDDKWEPVLHNRIPEECRACQVVDFAEDRQKLYAARRAVAQARFVVKPRTAAATAGGDESSTNKDEEIYQAAVGQGFDEEEEFFNLEAEMSKQSYTWEDKYRPRKPRYFNKVHTGYEWNKYNQTHYDSDNPPPKVVQGYKFNIFYPDLIDKTKAPQFRIIKNKENPDICTIVFTAGPPYEDIAFTIVNRPWEHSHKRGFRSSFDRGVLQLHFSFRRNFYRK
ncbi:hypothetical protein C6P46_001940 [Rhodotorula mucilaginosa]|uniref:Splicing factor Cactin n=1 Tax=Rhodotorula mucilaginosa TaxID=5537 RepID=A0A9P7B8J1_RHOMI|nr:hypothetical protein C6P46_001940 [Rhodotorula mucilaginosa]